ncbi:MAG: conjugal transfer protein TraF [Chlorobi bacterium]|nr:conjugal transfer protein TraF [Chlorobiota bacterium]
MKKASFFTLLLLMPLFMQAQKYANAFLDIGVDAASIGAGSNVTATIDNVNAIYWNPAGLMRMDGNYLSLMHARYFGGMASMNFLGYAVSKDRQRLGLALFRLGVDNIMNTTRLIDENGDVDYNRITYFSAADYALMAGYARDFLDNRLHAGLTAKLIYRHIGDFADGYGFGFDLGAQYDLGKWQTGLVLRDVTTTFSYWHFNKERLDEIAAASPGHNQTAPSSTELRYPSLTAGIARRFTVKNDYHLLAALDLHTWFVQRHALVNSAYFSMSPGLSLTADYKEIVYLRLGTDRIYHSYLYGTKVWHVRPAAGIGLRFKYLQLDYALTDNAASGKYSHVFSFIINTRIFKSRK